MCGIFRPIWAGPALLFSVPRNSRLPSPHRPSHQQVSVYLSQIPKMATQATHVRTPPLPQQTPVWLDSRSILSPPSPRPCAIPARLFAVRFTVQYRFFWLTNHQADMLGQPNILHLSDNALGSHHPLPQGYRLPCSSSLPHHMSASQISPIQAPLSR